MTNHSVESLLTWMRSPAHEMLWGWDCIAAMARGKTNRILLQDYLARFDSGSYLPAISGEVMISGNDFKEAIHDFVLDVPLLSFAASGLDDAKAGLTMSVISGMQLGQRKDGNVWQTVRLSEIDPLQGPELSLDLDLDEVPGTVGQNGEVKLDLRHSDNFNLNFALTEEAQRKGGEFFRDLFNALPDAQRVFVLGMIEPGVDQSLRPQSFRLRAQRKAGQALAATPEQDVEGAILVFIRMADGEEGGVPDSTYPYLIPNDADKDYSATVLFSERRFQRLLTKEVMDSCMALIETDDFNYRYDANGRLQSAVANSGALRLEPRTTSLLPLPYNGDSIFTTLTGIIAPLPANTSAPLTVTLLDSGGLSIDWQTSGSFSTIVKTSLSGSDTPLYPDTELKGLVRVDLSATYALVALDNDLVLNTADWYLDVQYEPDPLAQPASDATWGGIIFYVIAQLAVFYQHMIQPRVEAVLKREFALGFPVGSFLKDSIQLNFGRAIQTDTLHLPRDFVTFGHINPVLGTFEVVPWKPVVRAGTRQLMTAQPEIAGLVWAVEGLQSGVSDPGSVDAAGMYQAPQAQAFEGRFLRVRITATDPASGYRAMVLVTVVREALTVNPLIQECAKGGEVQLQAGLLGEGTLTWSIRNPVAGQSGSLTVRDDGRTCTYKAVSQLIPGQTYVLDEIEVRDSASSASRSVHVLVVLAPPSLSVSVIADPALPAGQVRFQVGASTPVGVQWHLPLGGPGALDPDTGVYTPDNTALQRFVLVMARFETAGLIFEGHLLRPLPLARFP